MVGTAGYRRRVEGSHPATWNVSSARDRLDTAPVGNEQGHCRRYSLYRSQADPFVVTVDVAPARAVAQSRNLIVKRIDARIEIGARHECLQFLSRGLVMRLAQYPFGVRARLQHIAFREKAVEGDLRRVVGQKSILAGKGFDRLFDLATRFLGGDAGIKRNAAIDTAPGRNRRGPVAAFDLADIQIDRMRLVLEMLAPSLAFVPGGFPFPP